MLCGQKILDLNPKHSEIGSSNPECPGVLGFPAKISLPLALCMYFLTRTTVLLSWSDVHKHKVCVCVRGCTAYPSVYR